jgi:hypothetical protein
MNKHKLHHRFSCNRFLHYCPIKNTLRPFLNQQIIISQCNQKNSLPRDHFGMLKIKHFAKPKKKKTANVQFLPRKRGVVLFKQQAFNLAPLLYKVLHTFKSVSFY